MESSGTTNEDRLYEHLTKYFNMTNLNLKEYNITADYLNDFVVRLVEMSKNKQQLLQTRSNDSSADTKRNFNYDFIKNLNLQSSFNKSFDKLDQGSSAYNLFYNLYSPTTASDNCDCYCGGVWRDSLLEYKNIHGYIALVICLFGTLANIFNVIVLTRKEMKAPINIILKWLAVTDMVVMLEYIPFSIYMYLIFPDRREFKYSWAVYLLFHMHFTQILHTISISLTVTLAIWRYIAIKHPHGTLASLILSHCNEAILLSYIVAPILCFPTYFVFRINEKLIEENHTKVLLYHLDAKEDTFLYRFNFWVHSVIIKLLPCFILTLISFVLIRVLYKASKRKIKLKGYSYQPSANDPTVLNGATNGNTTQTKKAPRTDRRTDRTTMLLVAVLLLFLITEFPQGILGLLSGILQKCFLIRCYSLFGEVMDFLALTNAAVGFILYGLMSKQFRKSFKAVILRRRTQRMEMTTKVTGVTTTCV